MQSTALPTTVPWIQRKKAMVPDARKIPLTCTETSLHKADRKAAHFVTVLLLLLLLLLLYLVEGRCCFFNVCYPCLGFIHLYYKPLQITASAFHILEEAVFELQQNIHFLSQSFRIFKNLVQNIGVCLLCELDARQCLWRLLLRMCSRCIHWSHGIYLWHGRIGFLSPSRCSPNSLELGVFNLLSLSDKTSRLFPTQGNTFSNVSGRSLCAERIFGY